MKNLSERQQEVLALLTAFQNEHGFPPTCGELAELMGVSSPNAAATVLQCLKRKGAITISRGKSRGINLVGVKKFWSLTAKGCMFGKNITSPANPRETQPHFFESKAAELLRLMETTH